MKKIICILCISLFAIGFADKSLEALGEEFSELREKMSTIEETLSEKYKNDEVGKAQIEKWKKVKQEEVAAKKAKNYALYKKHRSVRYKLDKSVKAFFSSKNSEYKKLYAKERSLRQQLSKARRANK